MKKTGPCQTADGMQMKVLTPEASIIRTELPFRTGA